MSENRLAQIRLLAQGPNFATRGHGGNSSKCIAQMAHCTFFVGSLTHETASAPILRGFQQFLSQAAVRFCLLGHVLPLLKVRPLAPARFFCHQRRTTTLRSRGASSVACRQYCRVHSWQTRTERLRNLIGIRSAFESRPVCPVPALRPVA